MTPLFRAKPYSGTDLNTVRTLTLPMFDKLNAYPSTASVEADLAAYYAANPAAANAPPGKRSVPADGFVKMRRSEKSSGT